jgi:hypothetical protein
MPLPNPAPARSVPLHVTTATMTPAEPLRVPSPTARRYVVTLLLAALILLGGALRFQASRNLFWFDEILSWHVASVSPNALHVLFGEPVDNNHPLNTLWIYALGDRAWWPAYRLLAVITGTALLALLAMIARRDNPATALITLILATFSPFLIQYASEARGYAPAMFFAVACFELARRFLNEPRRRFSLAFTACTILGMLAHTSFLYAYLAIAVWTTFELWKRQPRHDILRLLFRLHAVPIAFIAMFYLIVLRHLQAAGGTPYPSWRGARDAIAWTFGWPQSGWMTITLCAAVAAMLISEILRMARQRQSEWIFYTTVIFIAPALALIAWRQSFVYPRYFAITIPFVLPLIAKSLSRSWQHGRTPRLGCITLLALVLWGDLHRYKELRSPGRGQYLAAIDYILEHTNGPVTIASHQDARNELTFDFYKRYLPPDRQINYIKKDQLTNNPPQWLLIDCLSDMPPQSSERTTPDRSRYRLARVFRYSGLSGFDWWIYEREIETSTTPPQAVVPPAPLEAAPAHTPPPRADKRQ